MVGTCRDLAFVVGPEYALSFLSSFGASAFAVALSDAFADGLVPTGSGLLFPFSLGTALSGGRLSVVFGIETSSSIHESRLSRNDLPSISTAKSITIGRLRLSSTTRSQGSVRSPAPNIGQSPSEVRS